MYLDGMFLCLNLCMYSLNTATTIQTNYTLLTTILIMMMQVLFTVYQKILFFCPFIIYAENAISMFAQFYNPEKITYLYH